MSKLRSRVSIVLNNLALYLAKTGLKPIHLTVLSLITAFFALLSIIVYNSITLYVLMVITSGLLDALDGAVARLIQRTSKLGAFLDSTFDRLSDVAIIYPLAYIGFEQDEVFVLIILSLLISYVRARSESLGLRIEGIGLIERAERLIFIITISITSIFNLLVSRIILYLLIVLSTITIIQRIVYVVNNLKN